MYCGIIVCMLLMITISSAESASICETETNLALGKPVTATVVNGDENASSVGVSLSDITDGLLTFSSNQGVEDGCVGWRNSVRGKTMTVTLVINLRAICDIRAIRINTGNVPTITYSPDSITTDFGTTKVNTGLPNAWTTHYGSTQAKTVTVTLTKKNTASNTAWMFVGEIEVYGIQLSALDPPDSAFLSVPFVSQFYTLNGNSCGSGSCGPASLSMCSAYALGRGPSTQDIVNVWSFLGRDTCGNDMNGTSLTELASAANGWPFSLSHVYSSTLTVDGLKAEIAAGRPVLVHVTAGYLTDRPYGYSGGHYIAAIGYDPNYIICNDPGSSSGNSRYYTISDMTKAMADKGNGVLCGFYK